MTAKIPHHMIHGRHEYHAALRTALLGLAGQGGREVFFSDPDFEEWPLSDPEVLRSLTDWALPHRKMVVLAGTFDKLIQRHPRWVSFRQQFSHVVECRVNDQIPEDELSTMLVAPDMLCLRLFDRAIFRASMSSETADIIRAGERRDALLQQSFEAFPSTTLGL